MKGLVSGSALIYMLSRRVSAGVFPSHVSRAVESSISLFSAARIVYVDIHALLQLLSLLRGDIGYRYIIETVIEGFILGNGRESAVHCAVCLPILRNSALLFSLIKGN